MMSCSGDLATLASNTPHNTKHLVPGPLRTKIWSSVTRLPPPAKSTFQMWFAVVNSFVDFLHGNPFADSSDAAIGCVTPLAFRYQRLFSVIGALLNNKIQATTLNEFRPSILSQMLAPGLINFTPLLMSWC
jgi:hypothetical protein